jgi:branched-chain amino acid transport system substrate-binding protein
VKRWRRLLIPVALLSIVAAACGDDDDDAAESTTTAAPVDETTTTASAATTTAATTAPSEGETTTSAAPELVLDEPVSIIGLYEDTGESTAAQPFFAAGAQMAIDEINEAGGIGGQEVSYERIAAGLAADAAVQSVLQAVDKAPTAIIGLVSSGQVIAAAPEIDKAGIPTIVFTAAPQAFLDYEGEGGVGTEWVFIVRPRNTSIAEQQTQYVIDEFAPESVGLLCVNNPFGTASCDVAQAVLEEAGIEITSRETNEFDATDMTAQVLALGEPDVVIDVNFPNPLAVVANQLVENGLNVPHVDGASAGFAFLSGTMSDDARDLLYGVEDCLPTLQNEEWTARYEELFDGPPNYAAAETYDAVYMVKDAIERAGSTDPAAVRDALAETDYEGICTTYVTDEGNGLHHSAVIVNYVGGTINIVKELTF